MKKVIGFFGVAIIVLAAFFNTNSLNSSNLDTNLADLIQLNTANAECDPIDGCIPVDCPWWNPFCDDWDKSDPVSTTERISLLCWATTTDCYPGSSSCSEDYDVNCVTD